MAMLVITKVGKSVEASSLQIAALRRSFHRSEVDSHGQFEALKALDDNKQ